MQVLQRSLEKFWEMIKLLFVPELGLSLKWCWNLQSVCYEHHTVELGSFLLIVTCTVLSAFLLYVIGKPMRKSVLTLPQHMDNIVFHSTAMVSFLSIVLQTLPASFLCSQISTALFSFLTQISFRYLAVWLLTLPLSAYLLRFALFSHLNDDPFLLSPANKY